MKRMILASMLSAVALLAQSTGAPAQTPANATPKSTTSTATTGKVHHAKKAAKTTKPAAAAAQKPAVKAVPAK